MGKRNVLLLNATYEPMQVISWQKTMILKFTDKIEILEYYENDVIKTVDGGVMVPSVIKLKSRAPFRRDRYKFNKSNLFARDGFMCQYCGNIPSNRKFLTFDHVLPRSRGGKTTWDNIVAACLGCNQTKGDKTPEEAGMGLLSEPKQPVWSVNNVIVRVQDRPQIWDSYLW